MKGFDVVIDLAAVSNDPMGADFEDATFDINFVAQQSNWQSARRAGWSRTFRLCVELLDLRRRRRQRAERGRQKRSLNGLCQIEMANRGRACQARGQGFFDLLRFDLRRLAGGAQLFEPISSSTILWLLHFTKHKIIVLSDGTPWRPLVHTMDIGRAVAWASQANVRGFRRLQRRVQHLDSHYSRLG